MSTQEKRGTLMRSAVFGVALTIFGSHAALAQENIPEPAVPQTIGVSVQASILLGLGVSVGTQLGERFNVRGVYNGYTYSREVEDSSGKATYDGKIKLQSFGVLADWHPFQGTFRLTTGLLSDGNRITLNGKAKNGAEYAVGDCTYVSSSTDPLQISGKVDFRRLAPYVGLGWGGNMHAGKGFYGIFDLGVMLSGTPNVGLNAFGSARNKNPTTQPQCGGAADMPVTSDPTFQRELSKARDDAQNQADKVKLWPSIAFGLGWRF